MDAKEAKKITEANKDHSYARKWALDKIQKLAAEGKNFLILDHPRVIFFSDDYQYFRDLGYKVVESTMSITSYTTRHHFGYIEW